MWAFLDRWRTQRRVSFKRVMALEDRLDALELRVAKWAEEVKALAGAINSFKRWRKTAEDAPQSTNAEEEDTEVSPPPRSPQPSTAHLARRFRGG